MRPKVIDIPIIGKSLLNVVKRVSLLKYEIIQARIGEIVQVTNQTFIT